MNVYLYPEIGNFTFVIGCSKVRPPINQNHWTIDKINQVKRSVINEDYLFTSSFCGSDINNGKPLLTNKKVLNKIQELLKE